LSTGQQRTSSLIGVMHLYGGHTRASPVKDLQPGLCKVNRRRHPCEAAADHRHIVLIRVRIQRWRPAIYVVG
jgi:hypothetical protein